MFNKQLQKLSIYGFGQAFNLITPLLVAPYIIYVCGEENYGKSAVGMAIAFFLIVFVDFGSELTGVREVAINRTNKTYLNAIFTRTYLVKLLLLIPLLIISSIAFLTIPYFQSNSIVFLLSLTIVIGQFLNPTWFLQGIENINYITLLNILSKLIFLSCIFIFIKTESDFIYINLYWGLGMVITNTFILSLLFKKYRFSFKEQNLATIKTHIQKDFSVFSSQIFMSLQLYAPIVLIDFLGGSLLAGQYRIIEQVIVIFRTYILLFFNYIYPRVCYLLSIDYKKGIKAWFQYNVLNLIFIILSMLIVFFWAYEIVCYFSNSDLDNLSYLLKTAVFIPVLFAIIMPLRQLVLAFNYNQFYVFSTCFLVSLCLLLIAIILPELKLYGVFYAIIGTELIGIFFYIYRLIKRKKNDQIFHSEINN